MELIYSTQKTGFDPEKRYRNPEHFDRPEAGATQVVVVGDWPKIVEAYESRGVDVSVVEAPQRVLVVDQVDQAGLPELIGQLRVELDGIATLIEHAESMELPEHPGAGDLPIRLFDALIAIHAGIASIKDERDGLAGEVEVLRNEVACLKSAADQSKAEQDRVSALKAKLDEAGVTYRVNASVESLEKAVADLSKE